MITKEYIKMCEKNEEIQKSTINVGKRHFNNQDFINSTVDDDEAILLRRELKALKEKEAKSDEN